MNSIYVLCLHFSFSLFSKTQSAFLFQLFFYFSFFFFNDTAPPEIYPLPLPDALPIKNRRKAVTQSYGATAVCAATPAEPPASTSVELEAPMLRRACLIAALLLAACNIEPPIRDRKSTRLNSSH